ncbi:potassium channel subfamily K member 12 [Labeo rohita]|uniref:Potassium channel subfamily K member 12 n=1 Tax=Labeo rohita TaxID=84645 RepID=A0A498LNT6_LABRO|nr:potassium channel subfamily K member 12 [Labeo rohita]
MMPAQRLQGCRSLHINEDNGRFLLLAVLIIVYLLCGAAVFSAIERPSELRAHGRWNRTLLNFSDTFNISLQDLSSFLKEYEAAIAAGVRVDALRPRWDFTGAFYFVGTVVSTIGRAKSLLDFCIQDQASGLQFAVGLMSQKPNVLMPTCPG